MATTEASDFVLSGYTNICDAYLVLTCRHLEAFQCRSREADKTPFQRKKQKKRYHLRSLPRMPTPGEHGDVRDWRKGKTKNMQRDLERLEKLTFRGLGGGGQRAVSFLALSEAFSLA